MLFLLNLANADEIPTITLDEALSRAAQAPGVRAADAAVVSGKAQYQAAWSQRLPSVNVSGNVLVYDDEQVFSLVESEEPMDCSLFPEAFAAMCTGFAEPTVVREQVTATLTTRAVLPITGQIAIDRGVAAAAASRDAAMASADGARVDARWQAEDAWFTALQVERRVGITESQVKSLEQRVKVAEAAFAAGSLTRNDLLLAQLALGQVRQGLLQLEAARDASYGALGLAVGERMVRPSGVPDEPPRSPPDADALADRAVASHPSLVSVRKSVDAMRASTQAASWGRLPNVAAMATWQHSEGQGLFGEPDTYFVGATLDWTVWAWGKASSNVKSAKAGITRMEAQVEGAEAGVRLDVQIKVRNLRASAAAWELATASIGQAEENLKIQEVRRAAGSASMQEVLDAEAALVQARSNLANAVFDARRAEAALTRAVGSDPWGS